MANIVITNQSRSIGLPVRYDELLHGEQVVATNAPNGMLYVSYNKDVPILNDYTNIDIDEVPDGIPICLPYIEDYKEIRKNELLNQIRQLDSVRGDNETKTD